MFTLKDYLEIIRALPTWAYLRLVDKYNARRIENPMTVRALEIILENTED